MKSYPDRASTDPASPIRLAVIVGSNREGRFAPTVSRWFAGQLDRRTDIETDVIDLDDVEFPLRFGAAGRSAMTPFRERIGAADAIVVITPEYNHSYPAPLKQATDLVKLEWFAEPIGFVAYGASRDGARASTTPSRLRTSPSNFPTYCSLTGNGAKDATMGHQ